MGSKRMDALKVEYAKMQALLADNAGAMKALSGMQALLNAPDQVSTSNRAKAFAAHDAILNDPEYITVTEKFAGNALTIAPMRAQVDAVLTEQVNLTGQVSAIIERVAGAGTAKYYNITGAKVCDDDKLQYAPVTVANDKIAIAENERAAIAPKPEGYKRPNGFCRLDIAIANDATANQKAVFARCATIGQVYHVSDFIAALGRKSGIDVKEEGLHAYFAPVFTPDKPTDATDADAAKLNEQKRAQGKVVTIGVQA